MLRAFRKYHRLLAIIISLPLILTVITGAGYTIFDEWLKNEDFAEFLLRIHTMKILKLDEIYPVLTALGTVGLLVTGLSLMGLFRKSPSPKNSD
jgi:hypothetical protein